MALSQGPDVDELKDIPDNCTQLWNDTNRLYSFSYIEILTHTLRTIMVFYETRTVFTFRGMACHALL